MERDLGKDSRVVEVFREAVEELKKFLGSPVLK
jgi:hypothetical protein